MADKKTFVQAYNAQAAVDSKSQVIVANDVTNQSNDKQQVKPMVSPREAITPDMTVAQLMEHKLRTKRELVCLCHNLKKLRRILLYSKNNGPGYVPGLLVNKIPEGWD